MKKSLQNYSDRLHLRGYYYYRGYYYFEIVFKSTKLHFLIEYFDILRSLSLALKNDASAYCFHVS